MVAKKVPMRMCCGCGEKKEKRALVRVLRSPEGVFSIDLSGKQNGRGAYLCHEAACLAKARKAKRLERVFACQIPPDIYEQLERGLAGER